MKTFLTYLCVALLIYLIWKSPSASAAGIGDLAHAFVSVGNGLEGILSAVTGHPG
jgi:hypothetical protein